MPRTRLVLLALLAIAAVAHAQPASPPVEIHHIHGLAIDAQDPTVLLVATHTGLVRLGVRAGAWVGEQRFDLMGFTPRPDDRTQVFASGHPDPETYRREGVGHLGLILSQDGGRTWRSVALRGEADFHALAWSPRAGGQLYGWNTSGRTGLYRIAAGTWRVERPAARGLRDVHALAASPDAAGPLLAGTGSGLMASRDGGETWAPAAGLPAGPVTAVAFHSADARVVYAYVHSPAGGLRRSRDGGVRWEPVAAGVRDPVVALAVGPGEHVAFATSAGDVSSSRDAARSWRKRLDRGRPPGAG
ncbi:MAG TPA: hypothetical protein VFX28_01195 [Methylomirabilota bacterium]|nr:hypothetical protein [Methylomirabilota bacterium]